MDFVLPNLIHAEHIPNKLALFCCIYIITLKSMSIDHEVMYAVGVSLVGMVNLVVEICFLHPSTSFFVSLWCEDYLLNWLHPINVELAQAQRY